MTTKRTIRLFTLFTILAMAGNLLSADGKPEEEARKSAKVWLAFVDSGKYTESWATAAEYFKEVVPQDQWEPSLNSVRKPLGTLLSRKFKSAKLTGALSGAPDGVYVVLRYKTSFANKKAAIETVTPVLDKDGKWRVSEYYIK